MITSADMIATASMKIWWAIEDHEPGMTISPATLDDAAPDHGYYVGGASWSMVRAAAMITRDDVRTFIAAHADAPFIGMWTEDGRVFLDAVDHITDRDDAIKLGRERHELAIYDIANGQTITTG